MIFNFFKLWYFDDFYKTFFKNFLNFLRNVRFVDNITKFYYKMVECCLYLKKNFEKIISILRFSNFEKSL